MLQAKGAAVETDRKNRAWLAHTAASLMGFAYHDPKRMPALDSLIGERRSTRVQTPDEMKAVFAAMRMGREA